MFAATCWFGESGEDESRARSGRAAENLAATRWLATDLLLRDITCQRSVKGKLIRAAIVPDVLKRIRSSSYASTLMDQLAYFRG